LAFLQTFIFFNTQKNHFLTSLLSLEKIQKQSSRSKGEKNKGLLSGLQNTSFVYFLAFFGFIWTATASVLTGYLRLLCALNFLPFIAETLWV